MGESKSAFIEDLKRKATVTKEDVIALRRDVFADGIVERAEADLLFELNTCVAEPTLSWSDFFVEALSDFVTETVDTRPYVSAEQADYLIERIEKDGKVQTASELGLLVNVIENAYECPSKLTAYALETVKNSVLKDEGPLRRKGTLSPGVIGIAEVDLIERIIFGTGGEGNIAVTKAEAEFLFDLNDASKEAENDPAWRRLFVRGIANYLMNAMSYATPSYDESKDREMWLDSRGSTTKFMERMLNSLSRGPVEILRSLSADKEN